MGRGQGCADRFMAPLQRPDADAIVTIETSVRDDARERVNRYVARAKHLLTVIGVEEACALLRRRNFREGRPFESAAPRT